MKVGVTYMTELKRCHDLAFSFYCWHIPLWHGTSELPSCKFNRIFLSMIKYTVRKISSFQGWLGNLIVLPFIFKMQITLVSQKNHSVKNTFIINKRKKRKKTHRDCNSCLLNIRFITKAQPRKIAFFTGFWGGYSCTT